MVQQTGAAMANSLSEVAKNVSDKTFFEFKKILANGINKI